MGVGNTFDRWSSRVANIWTFAGAVVPGTIAAFVIGSASKSIGWISHLGAFGVLSSALIAFFLTTVSISLMSRASLWRVEARNRSRLSGDSSPFDPMQTIFQNKRIKVTDLVNPYDQVVLNKKFINCEIIGPANIFVVFNNAKFLRNHFDHADAIEIRDDAIPQNAIGFAGCDFEQCRFFKVSMLFQANSRKAADQIIANLNWLTDIEPAVPALEDQSGSENSLRRFFRKVVGAGRD
ncbi:MULTISPECIES: hypothetical protein [Sphingobium]|uniref:hypothetical protein n=1 Tax=Sphingobium TaxID=165695 RepID=UPI00159CAE87|nr:hypothetical protein [Sphingobium sp. 15-1]